VVDLGFYKGFGGLGWRDGCAPSSENFFYFLYQNGEFLRIPGDIYWHINCKPLFVDRDLPQILLHSEWREWRNRQ